MTETAPRRSLRVLHQEDSEADHERVVLQLRRAGLDVRARRVVSAEGFAAALDEGGWDVVLSDAALAGTSGLEALEMLRARGSLLPFVLVFGEAGEDAAVRAMHRGASDCLPKSRLERLAPAVLQAISAQARAGAALAQSTQRLHELAQHLQTSVEMERSAIAREIHDEVGGALTALRFDLAWIARHVRDAAVQQRVAASVETLGHAIEASQRIMHNLRPAILEQGLVAALQWMAERFERRTGIATAFRSSHEQLQLPPGVPLVAYRTAQEALTNISKHARATRVHMDLALAAGVLSLEVSDNGRGLAPGALGKAGSFGIRGLQERAGTVGGWIELSGGAGGTTLILSIPLEPVGEFNDTGIAASRPAAQGDALPPPAAAGRDDPTLWGSL
ncbi:histidine kinase [Caldimonas tepidiphila]|uniref:hybrid sensor histidine kinase/response regulator n=1 Tax=Caldimonas tepidiphila TaxID=2315841 RepID=UPI000E5A9600|nr:histidine kinase [Caldimonas tepidiphila]